MASCSSNAANDIYRLMFKTAFSQQARSFSSSARSAKSSTNQFVLGASLIAGASGLAYYAVSPKALTDPNEWVSLPLIESKQVNHNTKTLKFALPTEDHVIGLNVASALLTKYQGPNDEKPTIRPYTPISDEDAKGYVELMVKKYPNGPMSTHLCELEADQRILFKGPIEKYKYEANKHSTVGLLAAGTGITPMYQLIRAIMKNPEDKTKIVLVSCNITVEDILLKHEFEKLEQLHPDRFKAFYLLEKAPNDWPGQPGRISKELLKTVLPGPGVKDFKAFVCGPPGFYAAVCANKKSPKDQGDLGGLLAELGYSKDQVFKF
ncbi:hypothetical protein BCR37DRAFT_410273 [Protomyces lactucae-debilis]|uniref:NADH-cytochrome b5 reductase n=1 Tax=Protomyces lactucae-debilis TaxID=2754530 RepID=A0A1Y2FAA6_PROLT|nr:uncharacterized protein BCR37DRAFT_410273 [Protomyces lactucae-debilis]ORY80852.1 hypothetical protein BCR37DRAFT_410273 [Protomyces lactucae-debilis]